MNKPDKITPGQWCLMLAMALVIPCMVFTVLNNCLTTWPLYDHLPVLLSIMTVLLTLCLLWIRHFLHLHPFHLTRPVLLAFSLGFFSVQLICALCLRHIPFTDTEQIVTAAINLANTGAYETSPRSFQYFSWYPFNLGTVYLYAGLFRLMALFGCHDSYLIITIFAGLLFTAGLLCGTTCARKTAGDTAACCFLILCTLCFPFYYCTAELYTDVLALPFPMITLCLYLKAKQGSSGRAYLYAILFAFFSLIGFLVRVTTLILPIACLISCLFEKHFRLFIRLTVVTVLFLVLGNGFIESVNAQHLGAEQLRVHRLSVWHYLAMGLPAHEDEGYGQYGDGGWLILSSSFDDPVKRDERLKMEVKNRIYYLRYPNRLLNMLSRKNVSTFGDGTFHLNQLIEADEHEITNGLKAIIYADGPGYPAYYHLCTAMFYAQMLLATTSVLAALKSRDTGAAPVFIALVGAFIYLTLWETNARYFFMFEFLLLLAGAIGILHKDQRLLSGTAGTHGECPQ